MKREDKVITILGLSVLVCSLFLVAIPVTAIAAEQDDYVLGIYGNANEDDTIDMRDLTYVKLIFFGKKPETELADAKHDGKINPLDFIQIKLIIVGKEKELTIVDAYGEAVTVSKPVKRIVFGCYSWAVTLRTINANDKVVGIGGKLETAFFPELSKLPIAGNPWNPNYEAILGLHADVYMPYYNQADTIEKKKVLEEKLPGVAIICLHIEQNYAVESFVETVRKLGYILDRKDEAEEFIDFYESLLDEIKERVEELPEDEKPRVYSEFIRNYYCMGAFEPCDLAGGINIGAAISKKVAFEVDPEWVVEQNPDIIVAKLSSSKGGYDVDDPSVVIARREEILNRPELASVNAVREGKVYILQSSSLTLGTNHFISIAYMAKWFHPELFEDLDPQAIHQEYITRFQGLDYDLDKHGVFVYPPVED